MDEELDEQLAPLVDALTGAMAAVLLISIFMMLSTMASVNNTIKEYGQQALYENQNKLDDLFGRKPPELELANNKISFFKSFKMSETQTVELTAYFKQNIPKKITVYSNEQERVSTLNLLTFLFEVGLSEKIDDIKIEFEPAKVKNTTEFIWE